MNPEDVPDGPLLIDTDVVSYWLMGTGLGNAFGALVAGHEQAVSFATVVELWAEMHAKLSGHLQKGGANDLWTAACALSLSPQLPVVTNNLSDFGTISKSFPELRLIHPDL